MIEPRHRHLRGIAALPTAGTARTLLRMQTTCRQRSVAVCRLTPLSAPRLAPGSGRRGPPHVQPPATHPPQGGCKLTSQSQDRTARRSHSAHRDVAAAHRSHHTHKQHNETPPQNPPPRQQLLPECGTLPLPHSHVVHSFGEGGISAAHGHSCGHKEEQPETEDD